VIDLVMRNQHKDSNAQRMGQTIDLFMSLFAALRLGVYESFSISIHSFIDRPYKGESA
jgi:hypothetical protein